MSVEELVKRIRERARFQEAIRKFDKNAFLEQADISLSKEAADKLEELAIDMRASETELSLVRKDRDRQKLRGDNHWETLRSIREMAREGDCERIIQWVNDARTGYVEGVDQTMGELSTENARLATALAEKDKELAALREALEPSADTKAAYMGEFYTGITLYLRGEEDHRNVQVSWSTIKEIMKAISGRARNAGGTDADR